MKITLTFYPAELKGFEQKGLRVVAIDVLRACSTITHALAQGCRVIRPFASIRGCLKKARGLEPDKIILGGERGGLRIKGFHLGNSPLEYSRERVEGKSLLFTTTNCTKNLQAITRLMRPQEVLICSLLNLPALAEYLTIQEGSVHLALSGTDGKMALEDVVCGGMLIHRLLEKPSATKAHLSDSARLAHITYLHYKDDLKQALRDSSHGQRLIVLGMEKDLDFCTQVGIYSIIPRFTRGVIKVSNEPKEAGKT
jgi:2-phosphosulfolactate phosphatase